MTVFTYILIAVGLFMGYISTQGTKSQTIRLVDIFLIGPLMIYFGQKSKPLSVFSMLLVFFGATTITYNLKNYIFIQNSKVVE
jgi:uncharacterized membrane protein